MTRDHQPENHASQSTASTSGPSSSNSNVPISTASDTGKVRTNSCPKQTETLPNNNSETTEKRLNGDGKILECVACIDCLGKMTLQVPAVGGQNDIRLELSTAGMDNTGAVDNTLDDSSKCKASHEPRTEILDPVAAPAHRAIPPTANLSLNLNQDGPSKRTRYNVDVDSPTPDSINETSPGTSTPIPIIPNERQGSGAYVYLTYGIPRNIPNVSSPDSAPIQPEGDPRVNLMYKKECIRVNKNKRSYPEEDEETQSPPNQNCQRELDHPSSSQRSMHRDEFSFSNGGPGPGMST
jgi:hypothetical protein